MTFVVNWALKTIIYLSLKFTSSVHRGDGVAQLIERQTQDPKDEGSNPVRSTIKKL